MSVQSVRFARLEFMRWGNSMIKDLRNPKKGWSGEKLCGDFDYWCELLEKKRRTWYMAAHVSPKDKVSQPKFKGFINYVLSSEDKEQYKTWDIDDHDLFLLLAGDLQSGLKLSTSYNKQNDTYSATYMCNDDASPNAGYCLSAFAPDPYHALRTLIFKHNVVLDCIWGNPDAIKKDNWG